MEGERREKMGIEGKERKEKEWKGKEGERR